MKLDNAAFALNEIGHPNLLYFGYFPHISAFNPVIT